MASRLGQVDRRVIVSMALLIWAGLVMSLFVVSVRAGSATVAIRTNDFVPQRITIQAGDTVTWTNEDYVPHDALATDESWQTSMLDTGERGSITFSKVGTVQYVCSLHLFMRGEIVVLAAGGGMPATDAIAAEGGRSNPPTDALGVALLASLVGLAAWIRLLSRKDRSPRG